MEKKYKAEAEQEGQVQKTGGFFAELNLVSIIIGVLAGGLGFWMSANRH